MLISNARIVTPFTTIDPGAVRLRHGRIEAVDHATALPPHPQEPTFDATGLTLVPGFIDLQINGAFGHDFTHDPHTIWPVAAQLPRYGVTAFLPTLITSPPAAQTAAQHALSHMPPNFQGATPLGWHFEGPFLNPGKKGAHNARHLLQPDPALVANWSPQSGVRLVTLAPELPGALQLIRTLVANGVVVSAGHSLATFAQAQDGLTAGIRYGTHLFNAMPPLHHRQPGLAGALLSHPTATIGLIADGLHVHPALIALLWRLLGPTRLNLVSDAMAALGMPPGAYRLADQQVQVQDGKATLSNGALAGSTLSPDAALRNLIQFTGCSLPHALQTLTATPANLLGLTKKGIIAPGNDADLVLLTPALQVTATFVRGEIVFSAAAIENRSDIL